MKTQLKNSFWAVVAIATISMFNSCEDLEQFEPIGENSIADATPPNAAFSYSQGAGDEDAWKDYSFANSSTSATTYLWDFGNGETSTDIDGETTYPGEGSYLVTLTASDNLGVVSSFSDTVEVVEPEVPLAIVPTILNGDFTEGQDDWKFSTFTGGTTSAFNSSSDGSFINYDGTDNGAKTPGAKWTMSTSAGEWVSSSTRYAYQAITVSPNTEYILEYVYAIKDDTATDPTGGRRIVGEILDGHFSDGADAIVSSNAGPLVQHLGTQALGKTVFTTVVEQFTSNASGEVSILIYGVTPKDAYVDNVKVYPAE